MKKFILGLAAAIAVSAMAVSASAANVSGAKAYYTETEAFINNVPISPSFHESISPNFSAKTRAFIKYTSLYTLVSLKAIVYSLFLKLILHQLSDTEKLPP